MWCPVTGEPGEQREIVCVVGDAESLECDDEGELLELDGGGALLE